ncbi:ABC transporter permease [Ensifer canadensis]|uniref:ABC transporter permease n=1 Tax=Ensifer canadensis TaxID=555315 RepID=UPI0035E3D68E
MAKVTSAQDAGRPVRSFGVRAGWPEMLPTLFWLAALLVVPLVYILRMSFSADPFALTATGWSIANYVDSIPFYWNNLLNSVLIGLSATLLAFAIAMPVAYGISFYGRRWKTVLLFAFLAPFLTSYLIRIVAWQTLLGTNGPLFGPLQQFTGLEVRILGTPFAVVAGLTYQLVPFVLLPLYTAFNRVDRTLCAAADDLYSQRCGRTGAILGAAGGFSIGLLLAFVFFGWGGFVALGPVLFVLAGTVLGGTIGVTMTERFALIVFPLSRNGFVAAAVLSFIPALGDYVNAALLGDIRTQMLGNVIQAKFLVELDYAGAAALSATLLVAAMMLLTLLLRLIRGTELLDVV